jgi:CRISPR-associated exonuclease Cas4
MADSRPLVPSPDTDDYPPLSALNDLLFCPRRCALHRIEQLWQENAYTVEGSHAHRLVHAALFEEDAEGALRTVRGLWLRSHRLRLVGITDLVEFRPEPYPVEYKRGRKRRWDNDEVQLCAQALCLEEMLSCPVPAGAIFHVRSRRRREVVFDEALRHTTEQAVERLHALLASGQTPLPVLHPKCKACSLHEVCLPELVSAEAAYQRAAKALFTVSTD